MHLKVYFMSFHALTVISFLALNNIQFSECITVDFSNCWYVSPTEDNGSFSLPATLRVDFFNADMIHAHSLRFGEQKSLGLGGEGKDEAGRKLLGSDKLRSSMASADLS